MSPATPEGITAAREEFDTTFDGIAGGGYFSFANFLDREKGSIEEKFYNVSITQDANVSWVMFDFEFLKDEKVINHGVEVWQLMKTVDGSWKIVSVVWSSKGAPKGNPPG